MCMTCRDDDDDDVEGGSTLVFDCNGFISHLRQDANPETMASPLGQVSSKSKVNIQCDCLKRKCVMTDVKKPVIDMNFFLSWILCQKRISSSLQRNKWWQCRRLKSNVQVT